MFEQTNQADFTPNTQESTTVDTTPASSAQGADPDDFFNFGDLAEGGENQPDQEQAPEVEELEGDKAPNDTDAKPVINAVETPKTKVKYNGKEVELSHEELLTAAQKGLDYDHVRGERDMLRNAPEFKLLDEEAARYGLNRTEYMQRAEIARLTQEAKTKYPDISDEAAQELAELKMQDYKVKNLENDFAQKAQIEGQKNKLMESFGRIMRENKLDVMPDEVIELVGAGQTPEVAYALYENKQLKTKIAGLEQNGKNRMNAAPSMKDNLKAVPDPFLEGFLAK